MRIAQRTAFGKQKLAGEDHSRHSPYPKSLMPREPQPHPIDYRSPASRAPRRRRMPIWERLIVSAIFGGIFFGAFGCLCPFEAFQSLSIPILLVLQHFWTHPAPNVQVHRTLNQNSACTRNPLTKIGPRSLL